MARKESVVEEEPVAQHKSTHGQHVSVPPPPPAEHKEEHEAVPTTPVPHGPTAEPQGGTPTPLGQPPLYGKTPTSINQLFPANVGSKGTHFVGPVISGGPPGSGVTQGSAVLALALQVDYTMGAFSLPLQLPADAIVLWATTLVYTAWSGGTGDTAFTLGRTTGAADILASTTMGALHAVTIKPVTGTAPLPADANPGQIWINVTPNGTPTAGLGLIVILYMRPFFKWN